MINMIDLMCTHCNENLITVRVSLRPRQIRARCVLQNCNLLLSNLLMRYSKHNRRYISEWFDRCKWLKNFIQTATTNVDSLRLYYFEAPGPEQQLEKFHTHKVWVWSRLRPIGAIFERNCVVPRDFTGRSVAVSFKFCERRYSDFSNSAKKRDWSVRFGLRL